MPPRRQGAARLAGQPKRRPVVVPALNETEIDDRGLGPQDPADPAALQPDATLCPECEGAGAFASGETCPVGRARPSVETAAADRYKLSSAGSPPCAAIFTLTAFSAA